MDACRNMVLQILTDARQRHFERDIMSGKFLRIAYSRQHQELRGVDDTAEQDHLAAGISGDRLAMPDIVDAGGTVAVENKSRRVGVDLDREIVACECRPQISVC